MINSLNKLISQKSIIRKMARRILPRLSPSTLLEINKQLLAVNRSPDHLNRSTQIQTYDQTLSYSLDLGFGVPFSKSPKVSIIIPVFNNWWTTYRLLQTLRSNKEISQYEVIVVDDGSTDLTSLALSKIRGIKVISLDKNVGYLRATNLGASYAKGEFIALLNNDTEPLEGWLDGLVEAMEKDDSIGLAGSNLMSSDGKLQESGGQIFKDGSGWNLGRGQSPLQSEYMFVKEVDYCSAAAIVIRNELWIEIGGFDERFVPAYYEDTDLAFAVRQKGFKVVNIPSSVVLHVEGVSHGKDLSVGLKSHQVTNRRIFSKKWALELASHWENEGKPRIEHLRNSLGIVILVDRQFPAEFRDSGSIRTIRLAKVLVQLGYHVIVFADDASTTTLDHQKLRDAGIETHHSMNSLSLSLDFRKSRVKFVWLIRSEIIDKYLNIFEETLPNAEIICDLLDLNYEEKPNSVLIAKDHEKLLYAPYRKVLVSPYEVALVKDHFPGARIHSLWKPFESFPLNKSFGNRNGCLFVGGYRHPPNVEGIKWFVDQVVPILRDLGYSEKVRAVGTGLDMETHTLLENMGVEVLGGIDDKRLLELYNSSKIAIIPLLSGRGLKGKFAEAASHNLPIVSTTAGAEGFSTSFDSGFHVTNDPRAFAEHIARLAKSQSDWEQARDAISGFCAKHLSTERFIDDLQNLLSSRNFDL
jgi:GT2 family glycosyltransferase